MQDELRSRSCHSFAMRHVIERPLQLGMLVNIFTDFGHALARGFQALLELGLCLYFGLAECHLHAAVRINFAFARSFDAMGCGRGKAMRGSQSVNLSNLVYGSTFFFFMQGSTTPGRNPQHVHA